MLVQEAFQNHCTAVSLHRAGRVVCIYAVCPLAPDIVMYCHERKFWSRIRCFDRSLSIVPLTAEMVESENSGQVFMSSRFVFSSINDFRHAGEFAPTIGTELYAPPELRGKSPNDVLFGSSAEGEVPEASEKSGKR
jgi:hypothetical protein